MNESADRARERIDSHEALRAPRIEVVSGARGAFAEEIRAASQHGVETIDPLHSNEGLVMSDFNALSKRSRDYTVCTSLIALGLGRDGRNLSSFTHQIPTGQPELLKEYQSKVRAKLDDFLTRVAPGMLDVGFAAGEYVREVPGKVIDIRDAARNKWYEDMRDAMSLVTREVAGRELRLLVAPNAPGEHTDLFLDTEHGKLYAERYMSPALE